MLILLCIFCTCIYILQCIWFPSFHNFVCVLGLRKVHTFWSVNKWLLKTRLNGERLRFWECLHYCVVLQQLYEWTGKLNFSFSQAFQMDPHPWSLPAYNFLKDAEQRHQVKLQSQPPELKFDMFDMAKCLSYLLPGSRRHSRKDVTTINMKDHSFHLWRTLGQVIKLSGSCLSW